MPQTLLTPYRLLAALFILAPLLGCSPEPATAPENGDATEELGPNASIIRSPVDGNQSEADTTLVARLVFSAGNEFRFGEVTEGTIVRHEFEFTNAGSQPLLITDARSTCGCTVPKYPKAPIPPGEAGIISVAFDTQNKFGNQRKPVMITANTYPSTTTVYVEGIVVKD